MYPYRRRATEGKYYPLAKTIEWAMKRNKRERERERRREKSNYTLQWRI